MSVSSNDQAFGDVGTREGQGRYQQRQLWLVALEYSAFLLDQIKEDFNNTPTNIRSEYYPELLSEDTSMLFTYDVGVAYNLELSSWLTMTAQDAERYIYDPNSVMGKIANIYKILRAHNSYDYVPSNPSFDGLLKRINVPRLAELNNLVAQEVDNRSGGVSYSQEAFVEIMGTLDDDDMDFISQNQNFREFFSTTFDIETISMIPLIYNFYLTSEYFQDVNRAFENPKDRAVDIILSNIANDQKFNSEPELTRNVARAAIANSTGQSQNGAFNSAARDFILKALIRTPIDILKGLTELTDPHIAISKLIKTGTGAAFNEAIKLLNEPAGEINQAVSQGTSGEIETNLNGENILALVLCLIDNLMKNGLEDSIEEIPENFFPRVSVDGVDFTGTVSGMLMMPPGPLGIIYLLLELLRNDITNQTENVANASAENANANECSDEVMEESEEGPCVDIETV